MISMAVTNGDGVEWKLSKVCQEKRSGSLRRGGIDERRERCVRRKSIAREE